MPKERMLFVKSRDRHSQRNYVREVRSQLQEGQIEPSEAAQQLKELIVGKGARKEVVMRQFCQNLTTEDPEHMRNTATVVRLVSELID